MQIVTALDCLHRSEETKGETGIEPSSLVCRAPEVPHQDVMLVPRGPGKQSLHARMLLQKRSARLLHDYVYSLGASDEEQYRDPRSHAVPSVNAGSLLVSERPSFGALCRSARPCNAHDASDTNGPGKA